MKFLLLHTFYEPYLNNFFGGRPELAAASYDKQGEELINDGFGAVHMYTPYLRNLGYETQLVIANCAQTQAKWLSENGVSFPDTSNWVKDVTRLQIEAFKPDVLYIGNPLLFDSNFLNSLSWRPRLTMGWRAASIPEGTNWTGFDVMLSHLSSCRSQALQLGAKAAEHFMPGFPQFIAEAVRNEKQDYDVVFSGQWTPEHARRNHLIQEISKAPLGWGGEFSIGYFIASAQPELLPAGVAMHNQGARWGLDMYRALKRGKIVINAEINLAQGEAGNMRLFETTGAGAFLLTEHHQNIGKYFEPGVEIETFQNEKELVAKIYHYLDHPKERELIAQRGQQRCLRDHSSDRRAEELDLIIRKHLQGRNGKGEKQPSALPPADLYDVAYRSGWENPELKELVYLCYKTPNFADNARRFYSSPEFQESVRILTALGKPPGKNTIVLDMGCGNGVASYSLARSGYAAIGIDSSTGEIAGVNAARKIQGLDGAHFEIFHTAGNRLECDDESFDVIWMREALHHMKDLASFMAEMKRILKPNGIICCLRDVVVWNEQQREHFFATHPFYPITKDEGCFHLQEYLDAFSANGFTMEKVLNPQESVINTYPNPVNPALSYDMEGAKSRPTSYDLFSFFARKPAQPVFETPRSEPRAAESSLTENGNSLPSHFPGVSFGANIQVIGLRNITIGEGSCIGDNVWLNVCIRDDSVRLKIGKSLLIGRQTIISTAGYLEIGDYCVFAPRVYVSDADHIFADIYQPVMQQGVTTDRSVIVEENCWLGINTVISGNLTIGRGSVIGAGAVVNKDVPPFSVVVGNPTVIVKMYNPQTKNWEKTTAPEDLQRVMTARAAVGLPSRAEYLQILRQNAVFRQVDPLVAGNNICI